LRNEVTEIVGVDFDAMLETYGPIIDFFVDQGVMESEIIPTGMKIQIKDQNILSFAISNLR